MILSFDKFERYEMPQVTLCNPNSRATEVDGKITITDTVGVLSNPKGMNLKLNFNAPHELSFDYYRHKSTDPIKQSFYDTIYESIQTDRRIYLTDIGYFIISSVTDSDEDNVDKKSISCKSCEENELATAEGLYLKEGTYYLHTEDNQGLLDLFFPKTAGWAIGYIDPSLLAKPYFVEETEVDNGYNFLYTTVQDMFECIVEPDIIKRTISVYSRVYYAEHHLTDIHIAKYNLLKHKTVEENDEDKYTALNVQGKDENLEIRTVNPTGKNIIYNFEPRHSMMSSDLQVAVVKWQEKCESVEDEYLTLQQGYYNDMQNIVFPLEEDIKVLELQLKEKELTRDTIVYGDYDTDEYDEIQEEALKQVNAEIKNISTQISDKKGQLEIEKKKIEINYAQPISIINSECDLDLTAKDIDGNVIFTADLLNELMTHIKPTDYVDEYMIVTESMTYPQRFEKSKELMDRAQSQLVKISSGQKTYSIDTRSFLFNKQFKHFSEQLCAGAIIYVETKNDIMEQLHLTGIDINFDEKSTNFTLGNKYDRSDLKALYEDALGQNSKSFSELKYIASIIEDQQKQLDYQRNWVADLRTLTLDNVLTSEDQAIEINNRGLIGRKRRLNEDGSWKFDENGNPFFEDEQVKLIHNSLIFTKDNWAHAEAAIGKIAIGYNSDGSVKYDYGFNGRVIIGELILGNNLVLTGTGAGIKITDSSGNNVFYADDNGNLSLSAKIFAEGGEIAGWEINKTQITKTVGDYTTTLDSSTGSIYSNNITAAKGYLGNWTLDGSMIYSTRDGVTTGLQARDSGTWAIAVGATNFSSWATAPFRVDHEGNVVVENITATGGKIAGWNIGTSWLQSANIHSTSLHENGIALGFDGDTPRIIVRKWSQNNSGTWVHTDYLNINGSGGDSYIAGWKITAGGFSSGKVGVWKENYHIDSHGQLAFTAGNGVVAQASFRVYHNGDVVCNNLTATGGSVGGWKVGSDSTFGISTTSLYNTTIKYTTTLFDGGITTSEIRDGNYPILSQYTVRWDQITSHVVTGSDRRIKTDITSFNEKYDSFFDSLSPCVFKFTVKDINRKHSGFIAQEVQDALTASNLLDEDFGAIEVSNNFGFDDVLLLDKDEFIALNTWQIQKLKSKVVDLENTVAELKTQIQTLTAG